MTVEQVIDLLKVTTGIPSWKAALREKKHAIDVLVAIPRRKIMYVLYNCKSEKFTDIVSLYSIGDDKLYCTVNEEDVNKLLVYDLDTFELLEVKIGNEEVNSDRFRYCRYEIKGCTVTKFKTEHESGKQNFGFGRGTFTDLYDNEIISDVLKSSLRVFCDNILINKDTKKLFVFSNNSKLLGSYSVERLGELNWSRDDEKIYLFDGEIVISIDPDNRTYKRCNIPKSRYMKTEEVIELGKQCLEEALLKIRNSNANEEEKHRLEELCHKRFETSIANEKVNHIKFNIICDEADIDMFAKGEFRRMSTLGKTFWAIEHPLFKKEDPYSVGISMYSLIEEQNESAKKLNTIDIGYEQNSKKEYLPFYTELQTKLTELMVKEMDVKETHEDVDNETTRYFESIFKFIDDNRHE